MSTYSAFSIQLEVSQRIARVAPSGELDMSTVPELVDNLLTAESDDVSAILVDLRGVTFMDSTGLKAFLDAAKRSEGNGHRLAFVGVRPEVRRIFELTGTDSVLDPDEAARLLTEFRRGASVPGNRDPSAGFAPDD